MLQSEDKGFDIVPRVFGTGEVDHILAALPARDARRARAGSRHLLSTPAINSLASDPRLLEIAASFLGQHAVPFRATLFDKSDARNWLVVWHQDTALPIRHTRDVPGWGPWSVKAGIAYAHAPTVALSQVVALRIHLDDSNAANGPLRVLPRTHRLGVLTDEAVRQYAMHMAPVDCLVGRGGILAMKPLLIHASSKSTSRVPRRVIHVEYASCFELGSGLELAVA